MQTAAYPSEYGTPQATEESYFERNKKLLIRYGVVALLTMIFILLLGSYKVLLLVPLLAANVAVSWMRRHVTISWVGFELILITTVFSGAAFGSVAGIVMGVICLFTNYAFSKSHHHYFFLTVPIYMFIGFIAAFIPLESLVGWGIVVTFFYNAVSFMISKAAGAKMFNIVMFMITNILFNIFLFVRFGPMLTSWVG